MRLWLYQDPGLRRSVLICVLSLCAELKASIDKVSQALEGMYSDNSLCQVKSISWTLVGTLILTEPFQEICMTPQWTLTSYLMLPGALQTTRCARPWGTGLRWPLLGVHLWSCSQTLAEVQRCNGDGVDLGRACSRLVRWHDQRKRLLPHVHQWQATIPHSRYFPHVSLRLHNCAQILLKQITHLI